LSAWIVLALATLGHFGVFYLDLKKPKIVPQNQRLQGQRAFRKADLLFRLSAISHK
jgi:hypothetical protein